MKSIETEPYMRRVKTSTALSCHHRQLLSITPLENSDSSVYEYFWNSSRNQTYYFLKVRGRQSNPRTACHEHTFNCYSYQSNQFNVQRLNLSSPCDFQFVYGRVYLPRCGCRSPTSISCANQPLLLICVDFLVFPNALKQYDILFLELIGWNQCLYTPHDVCRISLQDASQATLNSAHCVSAVWPIMKQRLPHGSSAVLRRSTERNMSVYLEY
ncbi:Hypothetical_protein [Hexamita inflata]|uniref:Hypothetical_protein n=1 Tax=Hexamita inflata TaxID=28002 RepID=A0ABP1K174_9EUKA